MPAAARLNDPTTTGHGCDSTTTVVGPSNNVFVNNLGLERKGDPTAPHTIPSGPACVPHSAVINVGSPNVFTNNIPTARVGDSTDGGAIIAGSPNVFINNGAGVPQIPAIRTSLAPGVLLVDNRVMYENTEQGIDALITEEKAVSPNLSKYHEEKEEDAPLAEDATPPDPESKCVASKHFTLADSKMPIEAQRGLTKEQIECNWIALCENILDPLRDAGYNFRINSAFRTLAYNRRIGSKDTSDHTTGCAVDISMGSQAKNKVLFKAILNKYPYSQLIFEGNWIHVSYGGRSPKGVATVMWTYTGSNLQLGGTNGERLPEELQA